MPLTVCPTSCYASAFHFIPFRMLYLLMSAFIRGLRNVHADFNFWYFQKQRPGLNALACHFDSFSGRLQIDTVF